ncbi:NAD(P)H-binding protein [Saccharothrix violaceirubra]|uniref:Uncharacterized protein YbjT (DUF2867 family) n=1 Tax=Saccharothrix violaceirubra TaxID=413306 RepID=A0A7W7SY37_9PSEU|nr:NAD(P)H-binding protein [Saccharothrix violaceirubra]MBB4963085.1 uncharacterized protein YbjT (DUF2867 family) [Saccharothrix violaceirubra]
MTILVTGATGTVGGEVVRQLGRRGVRPRALSRRDVEIPGADAVRGDLVRPESVPLDGVTALFLVAAIEEPDPAALVRDLLTRASGVERVVFLSSDAVAAQRAGSCETHEAVERAIEEISPQWTHVRPGEFMSNKLVWARTIKEEDVVRAAYPDALGAPVHEGDIAEVAVHALTEDGHHGQAYRLSGPELLTHRQQAEAIGRGLGRTIGFEALTYRQQRETLIRDVGLPYDVAEYLMGYFAQHNEEPPPLTDDFERITGRKGRTLADWAADHAGELAQTAP